MAKQPRTPKPRRHATGQLVADFNGKSVYFGLFDDPKSMERYAAHVLKWLQNDRKPIAPPSKVEAADPDALTLVELAAEYRDHANATYRKNDRPTKEFTLVAQLMRELGDLFPDLDAESFSIKHFTKFRQSLIDRKLSRSTINQHMRRIRTMFRWAAEGERVSFDVAGRLSLVRPLKRGTAGIREGKPTKRVGDADVEKVKERVKPMIRALIEFQRATGCRAGEMVIMRPCDIDRSGDIWIYRPSSHKAEAYHERVIFMGEKAKAAILPWLEKVKPTEELFRHTKGRAKGEVIRPEHYAKAVKRACKHLGIPHWRPHQLRHARIQEERTAAGLDAAMILAGHASATMTETYSEPDIDKGVRAAKERG